MGRLIAAARRAESAAVVVATSKWSAMIGVVSECRSVNLELLAKQWLHRPNSTNRLARSTDVVSEKKRKKEKPSKRQAKFIGFFSHTQKDDSKDPGVKPPGDPPAH